MPRTKLITPLHTFNAECSIIWEQKTVLPLTDMLTFCNILESGLCIFHKPFLDVQLNIGVCSIHDGDEKFTQNLNPVI
jgi:hypothetical protein